MTRDLGEPDDWQPATSLPGELYTPEGQIRAAGSFARGLKNSDPRLRAYRSSMRRTALVFVGLIVVVVAVATIVSAFV